MNFRNMSNVLIGEGRVRRIKHGDVTLWEKYPAPKDILAMMTNTWWISTSGYISNKNDPNWRSTDKIPVKNGAIVTFGLAGYVTVANVLAYDATGKVVGNAHYTGSGTAFYENIYHVPEGATHITISGHAPTNTLGPAQYASLSYAEETIPPKYYEDGLILWCDGVDNTGNGHNILTTTWADLSGSGNDMISVNSQTATTPSDVVNGAWFSSGIYINAGSNQFVKTVNEFDLGADRTIEIRFTLKSDVYATFGFYTGDRYKYRMTSNGAAVNDWVRFSASNTSGIVDVRLNKSATVDVPSTASITRQYNAEADTTVYTVYLDGVQVGTKNVSGNHRAGETSSILLGNERDDAVFHSVRLYNRALSAAEIVANVEYDRLHFSEIGKSEYITDGMLVWCDGVNNTGDGHSNSVTTWVDLSGNGNNLINVASKTATTAPDTVQGVWEENGITIDSAQSQFLRSVSTFDLGADRTMEMRVTPLADSNMEIGLLTGERLKLRSGGANWFFLLSYSDVTGVQTLNVGLPTVLNEPITVSVTRQYDAVANSTTYKVYSDGVLRANKSISGNYREGEVSHFLFDDENVANGIVTVHSLRFYNRVLTAEEIAFNYKCDNAQL